MKIIKVGGGYVLRVRDGTEMQSQIYCLVWEDCDTQTSLADINTLDVLVNDKKLIELVDHEKIVLGSYLRMTGLRCKMYKKVDSQGDTFEFTDSQDNCVDALQFILENSNACSIEILTDDDPVAKTIEKRIRERNSSKVHMYR